MDCAIDEKDYDAHGGESLKLKVYKKDIGKASNQRADEDGKGKMKPSDIHR